MGQVGLEAFLVSPGGSVDQGAELELDPSHGAHPGEEDEAAQIPLAME